MFNILHDSIFNPKALVKQVNRSGWFIFLYMVIMAIFMSLGQAVQYIRYDNSSFSYENTGCQLIDHTVVCDGDNYDIESLYNIYGIRVYFLNGDIDFSSMSVPNQTSILVQGDSVSLWFGTMRIFHEPIFSSQYNYNTIEEGMAMFTNVLLYANIISVYINNIIVLIAIILISTLMFLRYRKEIKYGKLFKLTAMAVTPVALLITFYNIILFNDWIFFALGFFAYMPMFRLNRELYYQAMLRKYKQEDGPVVESYTQDDLEDNDEDDEDNN